MNTPRPTRHPVRRATIAGAALLAALGSALAVAPGAEADAHGNRHMAAARARLVAPVGTPTPTTTPTPTPTPTATPTAPPSTTPVRAGWERVYRHDFSDLKGVNAFQSSKDTNDGLRPSDTSNSPLQKPTLSSNVTVLTDSAAVDGKAMAVWTRKGTYQTSRGTATGWTNGRMALAPKEAPPVRVTTRLRMTRSTGVKAAVMWWPAGGGWPWEVDFAETFGGKTLTDYWGSRQYVGQRWHADLNGDGKAKEQLIHDDKVDATQFHVYDLFITPSRMWIEIDGRKTYETTDKRFIPKGPGFFTVGKALTGRRDSTVRTEDAVVVDYVEIYRPS